MLIKTASAFAYAVAAAAVLAVFFTGIKPMLLNSPPTGLKLLLVVLALAGMLYVLCNGPLWVLRQTGAARLYVRRQLSLATAVLSITMAACGFAPFVPAVATIASGSFAGVALLLRVVAGDDKARPRVPGALV